MGKKIAILQPNYIPWKGVFDLIDRVDVFVFYDDVQYTKKDWRSRNKIKTKNGEVWLTVPVDTKNKREQLICEAKISAPSDWQTKHYLTIRNNYSKAQYFRDYEYVLDEIYIQRQWTSISELGIFSTILLANALGITAEWHKSSDLGAHGGKEGERAINICRMLRCDHFINGPSSREFMNEELFKSHNITLEYMEYHYEEYEQLYKPFVHNVSVLDVLFNCGPNARKYVCTGI